MPVVISANSIQHIPNEEVLAEILGHSDFDGEDWAIGNTIIFEDGTRSKIELKEGDLFHIWSEPAAISLDDALKELNETKLLDQIQLTSITSWTELFSKLEQSESKTESKGCLLPIIIGIGAILGTLTTIKEMV